MSAKVVVRVRLVSHTSEVCSTFHLFCKSRRKSERKRQVLDGLITLLWRGSIIADSTCGRSKATTTCIRYCCWAYPRALPVNKFWELWHQMHHVDLTYIYTLETLEKALLNSRLVPSISKVGWWCLMSGPCCRIDVRLMLHGKFQ